MSDTKSHIFRLSISSLWKLLNSCDFRSNTRFSIYSFSAVSQNHLTLAHDTSLNGRQNVSAEHSQQFLYIQSRKGHSRVLGCSSNGRLWLELFFRGSSETTSKLSTRSTDIDQREKRVLEKQSPTACYRHINELNSCSKQPPSCL